ncbi:MAG: DUF2065 domain-containing protein [Desulfobacterales bacterium]|jgi:uncharacterized protein YjeT (DUF2065 family)
MELFLSVIGMVMIIEGLPYFAFPDKMKLFLIKMLEVPSESLRKFGLVLMIIGLVVVYLAKQ